MKLFVVFGFFHTFFLRLQERYPGDLQVDFPDDIVQFQSFCNNEQTMSSKQFLQFIRQSSLQSVFPNVDIALRLFLTLPITNASGERSFSKLALIKNRLRSTMGQDRLCNLTRMSIESDIVRKLDFTDIVKDFSTRKARKVTF